MNFRTAVAGPDSGFRSGSYPATGTASTARGYWGSRRLMAETFLRMKVILLYIQTGGTRSPQQVSFETKQTNPQRKPLPVPGGWQHRALQPCPPLGAGLPVSLYWHPASLLTARAVELGLWKLTPRFLSENESFYQIEKLILCKSVFCMKTCFRPNLHDDCQTQITEVHSSYKESCWAHAACWSNT